MDVIMKHVCAVIAAASIGAPGSVASGEARAVSSDDLDVRLVVTPQQATGGDRVRVIVFLEDELAEDAPTPRVVLQYLENGHVMTRPNPRDKAMRHGQATYNVKPIAVACEIVVVVKATVHVGDRTGTADGLLVLHPALSARKAASTQVDHGLGGVPVVIFVAQPNPAAPDDFTTFKLVMLTTTGAGGQRIAFTYDPADGDSDGPNVLDGEPYPEDLVEANRDVWYIRVDTEDDTGDAEATVQSIEPPAGDPITTTVSVD